jgi:hypothetical protein
MGFGQNYKPNWLLALIYQSLAAINSGMLSLLGAAR